MAWSPILPGRAIAITNGSESIAQIQNLKAEVFRLNATTPKRAPVGKRNDPQHPLQAPPSPQPSTDRNAQRLAEDLSGLADGANDIAAVVACLRSALVDSEAVLAVEEAVYRWKEWNTAHGTETQAIRKLRERRLSRESSPGLLTTCGNYGKL